MENKIAGAGLYSHEVPTVPGLVVEMSDGHHKGAAIWKRADGAGYRVVSYDDYTVCEVNSLQLVRGGDWVWGEEPLACDGDVPDGLAFYDGSVEVDDGEMLWHSEGETCPECGCVLRRKLDAHHRCGIE